MRARQFLAYRLIAFLFLIWLSVGFETSLWPHILNRVPPPVVWTSFILFMSFYGEAVEGVVFCYLASLILCEFSSISWAAMALLILAIYYAGRFVRVRFFWSGVGYFIAMNATAVIMLYVVQAFISRLFDSNPISSIEIGRMLIQLVLTPGFAYLAFRILDWVYKRLAPDSTYSTGVAR